MPVHFLQLSLGGTGNFKREIAVWSTLRGHEATNFCHRGKSHQFEKNTFRRQASDTLTSWGKFWLKYTRNSFDIKIFSGYDLRYTVICWKVESLENLRSNSRMDSWNWTGAKVSIDTTRPKTLEHLPCDPYDFALLSQVAIFHWLPKTSFRPSNPSHWAFGALSALPSREITFALMRMPSYLQELISTIKLIWTPGQRQSRSFAERTQGQDHSKMYLHKISYAWAISMVGFSHHWFFCPCGEVFWYTSLL